MLYQFHSWATTANLQMILALSHLLLICEFMKNHIQNPQASPELDQGGNAMLKQNEEHKYHHNADHHNVSRKLNEEFIATTSSVQINDLPPKTVIYATAPEQEFYTTLVRKRFDSSPRISQINAVWVALAPCMSQGGWIHPFVMDCFGNLLNTIQHDRVHEGTTNKRDNLRHIVIKDVTKILMDPKLNTSDPQYNYLFSPKNTGGLRLEDAGLVHIPCPFERQWVLIVANFIDKSFDVLNSDSSNEKFNTVITTVTNNFKILFDKSYPHSRYFNIKDFGVRYVKVPKHNFRYDSGVFVMQFIKEYDGIAV